MQVSVVDRRSANSHIHMYMSVCAQIHMHINTYVYIYIHIHICLDVYTWRCLLWIAAVQTVLGFSNGGVHRYALQFGTMCCSVLQRGVVCCSTNSPNSRSWKRAQACVAMWCSELQCATACCSVVQCDAEWCSVYSAVLQCVVMCFRLFNLLCIYFVFTL